MPARFRFSERARTLLEIWTDAQPDMQEYAWRSPGQHLIDPDSTKGFGADRIVLADDLLTDIAVECHDRRDELDESARKAYWGLLESCTSFSATWAERLKSARATDCPSPRLSFLRANGDEVRAARLRAAVNTLAAHSGNSMGLPCSKPDTGGGQGPGDHWIVPSDDGDARPAGQPNSPRVDSGVVTKADPLADAKPAVRKAWAQRHSAERHQPDIAAGQPGDKRAHEWLKDHGDGDDRPVDDFNTWSRYLRDARLILEGSHSRSCREHGSRGECYP